MKTITIGFSKPKSVFFPIFSWLIRLYQGTEFSHVYLEFYSESINRPLIYEAVGSGVRFVGVKYWEKHAEQLDSFTFEIKKCNYDQIIQYCVDNEGQDYGILQNVGIVISDLFKLKQNIWSSGKNCSEVIAYVLQLEGIELPKEPNLITPKDIYDILQKRKTGGI